MTASAAPLPRLVTILAVMVICTSVNACSVWNSRVNSAAVMGVLYAVAISDSSL